MSECSLLHQAGAGPQYKPQHLPWEEMQQNEPWSNCRKILEVFKSTRLIVHTHGACEHIQTHIPSVRFYFRVLRVIVLPGFFFFPSIKKKIYAFLSVKSLQHYKPRQCSAQISGHLYTFPALWLHTECYFSPLPHSPLLFHPLHSTLYGPLTHSTSSSSFTGTPPSR